MAKKPAGFSAKIKSAVQETDQTDKPKQPTGGRKKSWFWIEPENHEVLKRASFETGKFQFELLNELIEKHLGPLYPPRAKK